MFDHAIRPTPVAINSQNDSKYEEVFRILFINPSINQPAISNDGLVDLVSSQPIPIPPIPLVPPVPPVPLEPLDPLVLDLSPAAEPG